MGVLCCSARAVLHQSCDGLSRGPTNARSTRLAADLSTTMEAFEDQETYESHGRSMSSRFGREHARQQPSVVIRGRESAYATGMQTSMSRLASHSHEDAHAAGAAHASPVPAHHAAAAATVRYESSIATAAPRQRKPQSQGAGSHHSSTATLAYSAGNGRVSGHKRPHDQAAHANGSEALSSPVQETGYNTRAKNRRGPEN